MASNFEYINDLLTECKELIKEMQSELNAVGTSKLDSRTDKILRSIEVYQQKDTEEPPPAPKR